MLIQIRKANGCNLTQLLRSMLLGHHGLRRRLHIITSIAANLMDGIPISQDDKACKGAEPPLALAVTHACRITFIVTIRCRRGQTRRSDRRTMMRWAGGGGLRNKGNGFAQCAEWDQDQSTSQCHAGFNFKAYWEHSKSRLDNGKFS